MLSDKRILKSQRDGNALAVASAAQRYPVAVDFDILRPVQKYVHAASQPTCDTVFGVAQRTSQTSGSRLTERNPRYFPCSRLQHSTQRAARSINFHPHSVSRSTPNQSANSDAGFKPPGTQPASLTLQHGP